MAAGWQELELWEDQGESLNWKHTSEPEFSLMAPENISSGYQCTQNLVSQIFKETQVLMVITNRQLKNFLSR